MIYQTKTRQVIETHRYSTPSLPMSELPTPKRPRVPSTPLKPFLGSPDRRNLVSQASSATTALQGPSLLPLPPSQISRGRSMYSQSPPRSPNRSPARKLELIQLSPVKNTRLELQRIYDAKQSKKDRLCIKTLILNNFKSYYGEQIVGPFNSSFSAIVGPNGSGKSNVIDAMLFVFGFRASKMRQGKLSNLIHKSETHSNLSFCSVEIRFHYIMDEADGSSRVLTDRQELSVMRKAFRNNTSKYYINGKESSYTEVTTMLRQEGVDLDHKRFLILQGEVESIAQMKPKGERDGEDGLLEYLEDIIGTAKYNSQIESALVEINTLNDVCKQKENRFELVETEKESLESGKEEALEFLEKEKRLTVLKSQQYQLYIDQNQKKLREVLEKITNITDKMEMDRNMNNSKQTKISELTEKSKTLSNQVSKITRERDKLLKQKHQLERELASAEEKRKSLTKKRAKSGKLLKTAEATIRKHIDQIKEYDEEQVQYEEKIRDLGASLEEEREKLDNMKMSLSKKTSHIAEEIAQLEEELKPWNDKIDEKKSQIKLVEVEVSMIKESYTKVTAEIKRLKEEVEEYKSANTNQEAKLAKLKKESNSVDKLISVCATECYNAKTKLGEMKQVLTAHRQRVTEARSAKSSEENKNKVLTALLRLQKSGRIHGFHGRLGALGTIEDKYDVAISTACPRLDDIVVETVECAQQCIDHLRKNKLGYARFILLDKLRKFNLNQIQTPANIPRLFDLITFKEKKFAPAFYSVLRDTLVAPTLAVANKVAFGKNRFRVVTLDGKLIDISGTISGGGDRVSRGLMKSKLKNVDTYSAEEVQQMEAELDEKEKNFKIASDSHQEMEQSLAAYKNRQPELETEISKVKMELESISASLQSTYNALQEAEKKATENEDDQSELQDAEFRLSTLNSELKDLQEESKVKSNKIKSLQAKIMEIGGLDLQALKAAVDSLQQQISLTVSKQKRGKASIKKAELELRRGERQLCETEKEMHQIETELAKLTTHYEESSKEFEKIDESLLQLEDEKSTLIEQRDELETEIEELNKSMEDYKSAEIEYNNKLEKLNSLRNHVSKEVTRLEKELNLLKVREVTQLLQKIEDKELPEEIKMDIPRTAENSNILTENSQLQQLQPALEEEENVETEDDGSKMDVCDQETATENGLPKLTQSELSAIDNDALTKEIEDLQTFIDNAHVDIDILDEYAKRLAEYRRRKLDLNQAVAKRDEIRNHCEMLKKRRLEEFMEGFGVISMTLKEMYQMITMGGNAELELVDSLDPFSEGVLFSVMPPRKSWKDISNLSGGEKTLSSLALVFALHKYKPTPLYVMDEIDAALDFRNVSIVANYIKERTKNAQFIVISLRNNMFELAQSLVGIYKNDNKTRSVTIQNKEIINCV
ncbi:HHR144Wp [Eremothecium sinecaudum]|uniref:Structural maintenance of chromosomes protein n=1 Tax=Eremothecium sinecaudum TaxID=45286 RepID=A0A0X8HWX3_9SACH|nr:HHR144Wp [Eremothecium sinecaudum]AMD22913.1 HHR144Wp [Eremothecium sinecaudum]